MTKFRVHKKKGAAAIVTASVLALIALFGMTACSNAAQPGTGTGGSTALPDAPFIEGGASLILSPDKLDIKVRVRTADSTPVTVEGCTETELTSGAETVLSAKGRRVILKGKITELYCDNNQLTALDVQGCTALQGLSCNNNQLTALDVQGCTALQGLVCDSNRLTALNVQDLPALQELSCVGNQLTALNVQGCTALKYLRCWDNRLNADAFKKLFDDLPVRAEGDDAKCYLYIEYTGVTEGNHTNFTAPPELANAFNNAKTVKKWKMYKRIIGSVEVEI